MQLKFKPQSFATLSGNIRQAEDVHGNSYTVQLRPYTGLDFSKKCFVFPGQSAAIPEMGRDDYARFDLIQKRFATADALAAQLGISAPSLYVTAPSQVPQSDVTAVQCLALFTMSVALFELLLVNNEKPALLTSHSFGEYAMLVASGVASFEDMFAVVLERDRLCPPAGTAGVMIAISASANDVQQALGQLPAFVANTNSPLQTVVSVAKTHQKQITDALKKAKFAIRTLDNIPQPYHSALLADAAAKLEAFVKGKKFKFSPPHTPFLSSVTGSIVTDKTFIADLPTMLIAQQLTAPVHFVAQLHAATEFGTRNFVELAHHKICTTWIKDTLKDAAAKVTIPAVMQAEESAIAASKKAPKQNYDKKLVGLLNKVVSSVTGYSIAEISLNNNFQEDLGIDSIKKAQIILSFLESQGELGGNLHDGVAMSEIKNIEDVLAWYTRDKTADKKEIAERAIKRFTPTWIRSEISSVDRALAVAGKHYAWVALQQAENQLPPVFAAVNPYDGVIFYDDGTPFQFNALLSAVQAVYLEMRKTAKDFMFVYAMQANGDPETMAADGFIKSVAKELGRRCRIIQFDAFSKAVHESLVLDELTIPFLHTVKYEGEARYVQKMLPCHTATNKSLTAPTTVAAIGGARGITHVILKSMIAAGTRNIAIMGRRAVSDVADALAELRAVVTEGDAVTVTYFTGDATNRAALDAYLKQATNQFGTIDLLINGGGVEVSALVLQQTPSAVQSQTDVKIETTKILAELCQSYPISRVSSFASVAGEFGSPGQTVYSYANIAMTYLSAAYNKQLGRRLFSTIGWPAWNGVGMLANDDIYKQMVLAGVNFLDVEDGQRLYLEELNDADSDRSVCIDLGAVAHTVGDAVLPEAMDVLFPGVSALRSPLPLTAWTLKNIPDLKNHMVLEHAVVPMSLNVAMFFYAAYLESGQAYTLNGVKALSFMLLHQKESPYFLDYRRFAVDNGYGLHAEMRSNEKHVTATLLPMTETDLATVPAYVEPDPATLMLMDSQYDVHNLGKGDFKEGFGVLSGIRADAAGRSYATLNLNPPRLRLGTDPINWLTIVVESLLQLGGVGARVLSRKANAPVSLAQVLINPAARRTHTYKAVCTCEIISDEIATGTMVAYNEDGDVFVSIKDAQVRMWGFDEK